MTVLLIFVVLGLVSGSVYGLAAVGLVLTYRTSGVFNFAHGTVAALGAYVFYQLRDRNDVPWPVALVVAVALVGPLAGCLLEAMGRTLTNASVVARVVATLGVLVALRQVAVITYGASTLPFRPFLPTDNIKIGAVRVGVDQLIVMAIAWAGTVALTQLLRRTRLGLSMRGVVDNDGLMALTGSSPPAIRRAAWSIGCMFASLSGILVAPTIGLDAGILTLLVVQAFGGAALGLFKSLPMAYIGGLVLGIGQAFCSKYASEVPFLRGLGPNLPFVLLFLVLVLAPRSRLVDIAPERRRPPRSRIPLAAPTRFGLALVGIAALVVAPHLVGTKLIGYTAGLVYAIVFLSLVLLDRLSGQLSLAQLSFCAVGGTAFCHFTSGYGLPWLLAVLFGALIAMPVGAVLAIPAIRLSGLYLALASFGFGLLIAGLFYGQKYMFGSSAGGLVAPRPSFAQSDKAYYYVVLACALGAAGVLVAVRRAPLGRLLRAMADSPVALSTHGMNVTAIKVVAFCLSAFLAGLGGALLGPVTGALGAGSLDTFGSLMLVVILMLQAPLPDVPAAFAAAMLSQVVPQYLSTHQTVNEYLPVVFGVSAVLIAVGQARTAREGNAAATRPQRLVREPGRRGPVRARLEVAS